MSQELDERCRWYEKSIAERMPTVSRGMPKPSQAVEWRRLRTDARVIAQEPLRELTDVAAAEAFG